MAAGNKTVCDSAGPYHLSSLGGNGNKLFLFALVFFACILDISSVSEADGIASLKIFLLSF